MANEEQINQNYPSRIRPEQGGPERIMPEGQRRIMTNRMPSGRRRIHDNPVKKIVKRALLKKALPYLIAGGTTGAGIGWGWNLIL